MQVLFSFYDMTLRLGLQNQGAQEGVAPTIDVGDGDADVIGVLLHHGGLQCAGFLDKVRCFVCVRIGVCHQRQ